MSEKKMWQLLGAVERAAGDGKRTYWTRIGVAFQNKDGSFNLLFDYVPARLSVTTVQLRELDCKESATSE